MGDDFFDFNCYGSSLGREDRHLLGIHVRETDDPSVIFSDATEFKIPLYLKHLELDKFGVSQILKYRPHDHPLLHASQKLFLQRLQDVLLNRLDSSCKYDLYIHDLVGLLIMECQLSDGLDLYVKFSKLSLRAGSKSYTLFSEKEGRNSGDIRWILQTSKQKFDTRYKRGDIQLAAALIGACQANYLHTNKLDVKTLYGIKVLGEEFFFCRVDFETDYMKQLLTKAPAIHNVIFYRYPQAGGLRISKPEDRRKLLYFMYRLRKSMLVADCQVQC